MVKKSNAVVLIVTMILLGVYVLRLLPYRNELYVLHDEFAYWAMAAKYGGYSWKGMMVDSSYYAMGYSLLLVPLFWSGWDTATMYKCAIVLNAIFIVGAYLISFYLGKKLFEHYDKAKLAIVCGIIFLYPAVTMHVNYAWAEVFIMFLFWAETFFVCKFAETKALKWGGFASILSIIMIYVHQRTIGIMIAWILVFMLCTYYDKDKLSIKSVGKIICWLLVGVLVWIIFAKLKQYNLENVFVQNDAISANDFSGQASKVKNLFNLTGMINLIYSVIGKLYYFCVSTLLIGPFAIILLLKEIINKILHSKQMEWEGFVKIFLVLSFFAMVGITAIFFSYNYSAEELRIRIDKLFYGRYFECTVGPLLLVGLCSLRKMKKEYKLSMYVLLIYLIIAIITEKLAGKIISIGKVDLSAAGFNKFYWLTNNYPNAILHGAIVIGLVFTVILILNNVKSLERYSYWISLLLIAMVWIRETNDNDKIIKNREVENKTYVYSVVDYLKENEYSEDLVYVYSKEDNNGFSRYAFYMQFNLYEKEFKKIEREELEKEGLNNDTIYIVMQDSSLMDIFKNECEHLYSNARINLFRLEDNFQ